MFCGNLRRTAYFCLLTLFLFLCLATVFASAQSVSFSRVANSGQLSPYTDQPHADFNNDGREDLISYTPSGFTIRLANGDGTYAPPVTYSGAENGPFFYAIGDFNGDGWLDVVYTSAVSAIYEFLNNGDGTFHYQAKFVLTDNATGIVTGDFNHDGKPDLAFLTGYGNSSVTPMLNIWTGNGDGGFTPLSRVPVNSTYWRLFLGDFDGDGVPDVMAENHDIGTNIEILYGNGPDSAGQFTPGPPIDVKNYVIPADVDGDGISDLITSYNFYTTHGTGRGQEVDIYYGHSNRTFTAQVLPLARCSFLGASVADFNGDGIPDIAVREYGSCDASSNAQYISILLRNADGTYQPEQDVYSTPDKTLGSPFVLRANQDSKPDLAVSEDTWNGTGYDYNFSVLLNTTSGNFPTCPPPNAALGINVCSPGGSAPSGTVHFGIGAAGQTPMRKVEVWVDGNKAKEQLAHAFSYYGFLDADLNLADGSHTIDIYAAGWDNLLQHKTMTTTVGGTGGGGGGTGPCPQPASPGVNICSPTNGATATSPFTISAAGRNSGPTAGIDVWLDRHKVGWYSGTSVNVQVTAAAGSHQLDVYAVGANGELQSASTVFTVSGGGGGGTCSVPSSPGVNICSPSTGATVTSPFTISAAGRNSGSTAGLDVWLDGHKVGWYPATTVNIQTTAAAGSHQLDIYAVGTDGELQRQSVIFSVSSGSGGGDGSSCPIPSSAGVNVCAPTEGSTVNTPVRIIASGNNGNNSGGLDVWLDGQKVGWYDAQTIDINVDMVVGSHRLEIFPTPYSGTGKATVNFTVGGTGGGGGGPFTGPCDVPSDPNVLNMCSPASGSTISSPVRVAVHGGTNIDTIEMWYDGVKTLVVSGAGGPLIDIPYGMPSGSHKIDFYGKSSGTVLDHKLTQFTVTSAASGDVQYAVPLHRLTAGPGVGQVSVTAAGDVTASVSGGSAGTYGLKFCMYPASAYPDASCIDLGALNVNASGNGTTTVRFPQSGTWAGLFRIYDGAGNRVLETSGVLNGDASYSETYSAKVMTWVPSSTTNTSGAEVNGPQDPGYGLIGADYGTVVLNLTGAPANTTYSIIQCYMGGSSCSQIGTVITDASGNASIGHNTVPLTPGPIGVFRLSRTGASGFISGFRVP